MQFDAAYTMLLGRPWIHNARAVPSTLHQRIRYVQDGRLITVKGEAELMISRPGAVPYIENVEQARENLYHSFEIIETGTQGKDARQVAARIMKNSGFEEGRGLGAKSQGITEPITLLENPKRQGLGFTSSGDLIAERGLSSKGRSQENIRVPHLKETFQRASEAINPSDSVAAADEEEGGRENECWIQYNVSGAALDNWESVIIPDVLSLE